VLQRPCGAAASLSTARTQRTAPEPLEPRESLEAAAQTAPDGSGSRSIGPLLVSLRCRSWGRDFEISARHSECGAFRVRMQILLL
jgi:hypothetical protein